MLLSCLPSPLKTDKKEEINDVQLEQLVRYKGELPGWECGQVLGTVSRGSVGNVPYLEVSRPRGSGGPVVKPKAGMWTGWALSGRGSWLPPAIVLWVPTGEPLVRLAPWLGSPRR